MYRFIHFKGGEKNLWKISWHAKKKKCQPIKSRVRWKDKPCWYRSRWVTLTVLCAPAGTAVPAALCWSPWCSATGSGWWPGYRPGSHRTSSPSSAWPPMSSPPLCLSTTARLPPSRSAIPPSMRLPQSNWWKSWCCQGAIFELIVLGGGWLEFSLTQVEERFSEYTSEPLKISRCLTLKTSWCILEHVGRADEGEAAED